jgi:predicted lipoprotein with Yx(FWY)xxD motif
MNSRFASRVFAVKPTPTVSLAALVIAVVGTAAACSGDDDQTSSNDAAGTSSSAGKGNAGSTAHGGNTPVAGSGGTAPVAGTTAGGSLGVAGAESGGEAGAAEAGAGGAAGAETTACVFHTPASAEAGAGGQGAGGAADFDVTSTNSKTIGTYLTDATGHALYVFGSDVPGDCRHAPVSACLGAPCTQTWTSFSAGGRSLATGLDDAEFGDFALPIDGSPEQSTYHGWPLYRYVGEAPGTLTGQGIATLWHAVKLPFFNVMLMKKKLSAAQTAKYIADADGYAIYASSADAVGGGNAAASTCDAACSKDWPPFSLDRFVLPSSFKDSDFSLFVRADRRLQVAYRGKPLYRSSKDQQPGDTAGHGLQTFTLADPEL